MACGLTFCGIATRPWWLSSHTIPQHPALPPSVSPFAHPALCPSSPLRTWHQGLGLEPVSPSKLVIRTQACHRECSSWYVWSRLTRFVKVNRCVRRRLISSESWMKPDTKSTGWQWALGATETCCQRLAQGLQCIPLTASDGHGGLSTEGGGGVNGAPQNLGGGEGLN